MWIVYAMVASMLWGLMYVLNEQVFKTLSISFSYLVTFTAGALVFLILSLQQGVLSRDIQVLMSQRQIQWFLALDIVVFLVAEIFIALSITHKNATLAGLVEISYPVFIAIFAYLIFKQEVLNIGVLAGGLLIFSGIFVVFHFNQ